MTPILVLEQLLNGLGYGLMLFLLAAGLTLVFGIMDVLNLAHGSLFMAGAYVAAEAHTRTGSFAAAPIIFLMILFKLSYRAFLGGVLIVGINYHIFNYHA